MSPQEKLDELRERVSKGFQGGCYCCEVVATENQGYAKRIAELERAAANVPSALREIACTLGLSGMDVTVMCESREEAEELLDWLLQHVGGGVVAPTENPTTTGE